MSREKRDRSITDPEIDLEAPEAAADPKDKETEEEKETRLLKSKSLKKGILFCAIVFLIALVAGGPAGSLLNQLTAGITVIQLNWSALFRLILMVSGMLVIGSLCQLFFLNWKPSSKHAKTMSSLASSTISYVLALVGILWGLSILGVDVNALLAGAGVVALIIGFGAESLIADVITGIFMLFEHQYEVGDIIVVGDFRGTVTHIGIRSTSIADSGGNIKIINNSDVRNLINRSAKKSVAVCDLGVPYNGADIEKAKALLEDALSKIPEKYSKEYIFKKPLEYLGVQELHPLQNAAILRVVAEVDESDLFSVQRMLNYELLMVLEKGGISRPAPEVVVKDRK